MKTLLLSLALLLSFTAFGQSETPFKKANAIEIHTTLTPEQAYKQLAHIFQDKGYGIASSDAALGAISTDAKAIKHVMAKLNGSVRGDSTAVIILQGTFNALGVNSPIVYKGMNGSPYMLAWDELENVAKALPATKVLYR
jgi:hypothetical protein